MADRMQRRLNFAVVLLLPACFILAMAVQWICDWRVARCQSDREVVRLLGPAERSLEPGSAAWKLHCKEWGYAAVWGQPTDGSRAVLYDGLWWSTGYLVFYEDGSIVAIYRLNTG